MGRKTVVWILGDQLLDNHPALNHAVEDDGMDQVQVILVESQQRIEKRSSQRKKLVLLLSAMRHYAAELRQQGYNVQVLKAPTFSSGLKTAVSNWQPDRLICMAANNYNGRTYQNDSLKELIGIPVRVEPNQQFLTTSYNPYPNPKSGKRYLMEYFYRKMRRHFDVLMTSGDPTGGQWNYDPQNRKPLPKGSQPPNRITFTPDEVTQRTMEEVDAIDGAIGTSAGFDLAVTREQALIALDDFIAHRLADFGPYEDAMSSEHTYLYHSNLSAYLNIGLLEPMELIHSAEQAFVNGTAPINSVEGFIRQVLGWREYINWQYWRLMPGLLESNYWEAYRSLPHFYWDSHCDMNCLRVVIGRAIENGYNHHIERLMILCNFSLLAGLAPREVNEWFLSAYIDAYDWVMAPNVIGMGLNADGGLVATKPYIASANYINKMSDYCSTCRYDHRRRSGANACPYNFLFWNFLIKNEALLRANPRLGPNVLGLRHLDEQERTMVQENARRFLNDLDSSS